MSFWEQRWQRASWAKPRVQSLGVLQANLTSIKASLEESCRKAYFFSANCLSMQFSGFANKSLCRRLALYQESVLG